ncbi:hypothetical protein Esti_005228 [Eimeria stiedai]
MAKNHVTSSVARSLTRSLADAGKVYLCQVHGRFADVFAAVEAAAAQTPQRMQQQEATEDAAGSEAGGKRRNLELQSTETTRRCRMHSPSSESARSHHQNSRDQIPYQAVEATQQKPATHLEKQHQETQQQQQQEGALGRFDSTAAASTAAAPAAAEAPGAPRGLSGRAQRHAAKREQKLQKLLLKNREEERRRQARQLRHELNESCFDLREAVARKIVQPFVLGTNAEAKTLGASAASAAAAAAAAVPAAPTTAALQEGEGVAAGAVNGLFTGRTPFLLMRAKLRTVQASVQRRKGEGKQTKEGEEAVGNAEAETATTQQQSPETMHCAARQTTACEPTRKQLLQATWDEENGKETQTIFAQLHYSENSHTSFLLAMPITGRSHQIRKHVALLGHPIVGDCLYTSDKQSNNFRVFTENNVKREGKEQEKEGLLQRSQVSPATGAHLSSSSSLLFWWVRFSLDEFRHILPCMCNPRKNNKDHVETKCDKDAAWHFEFIQKRIQNAGGEAAIVTKDKAQTIQVLYRLEVPDSICLFALFYVFSPERNEGGGGRVGFCGEESKQHSKTNHSTKKNARRVEGRFAEKMEKNNKRGENQEITTDADV